MFGWLRVFGFVAFFSFFAHWAHQPANSGRDLASSGKAPAPWYDARFKY